MFFNKRGFSLVELLTVVTISATLTTIGIRLYSEYLESAKLNNVKHSLAFIFSSQQAFKNTWKTYHSNLMVIGASPVGNFEYDIGFKESETETSVPAYPIPKLLAINECNNFYQICSTACKTKAKAAIDASTAALPSTTLRDSIKDSYSSEKSCTFSSNFINTNSIQNCTDCANAKTSKDAFTAVALFEDTKITINESKFICEVSTLPNLNDNGCNDPIN